jgi:hydrogenase maturation protein HypF
VVLSGGCLANRLLDDALYAGLIIKGLRVWRPAQYPCGDGGLSLGQAWVARQRLIKQASCASPSPPA